MCERRQAEKSDKPCPFLTVQTYSTLKGKMKRHYCTARGLKDILPKTTWKNICLKGGICTIRQAQEWLNLKPTQQNLQGNFYDEEETEMRKLKIYAFSGEYQVFEAPYIRIKMYCPVCKKWVIPDKLSLGKAHIYATHCGISQDVGCVWFKEK